MKRSKINQCIREMEALIREHGFALPPFCHWTPEEWKEKGEENRNGRTKKRLFELPGLRD